LNPSASSNLFGTTPGGGSKGCGTAFEITGIKQASSVIRKRPIGDPNIGNSVGTVIKTWTDSKKLAGCSGLLSSYDVRSGQITILSALSLNV